METGDTGPSREALRRAFGIVKASAKKGNALRKAGYTRGPRFFCKICGAGYDFAVIAPDAQMQAGICGDCLKLLKEGYTAIVSMNPDRKAFIKHASLEKVAGKIVQLSKENFDKYAERFKNSVNEKQSGNTGPAGEAG